MARAMLLAAIIAMLASVAGCATHEIHGDRALPTAQRAHIEGYSRYQLLYFEDLQIVSVDGRRGDPQSSLAYASSVSVPAGRHWLQLLILRDNRGIAMCAFEWTFEAGHRYKLSRLHHEQLLLAHPATPRFPASLSIIITTPSEPARRVSAPAECGKEPSCRQSSDCFSGHECRMDNGFRFGTCTPRDR